jgi:pimeloyl-ACP methyl ester carboxylesterase
MTFRSHLDGALFVDHVSGRPPVVLALHGWGRDRGDLAHVVEDHDALLVDLPGFGASPPPPTAWGSTDYAEQLAELLRQDGRARYVVVGHSFGGRVAVALSLAHPELVGGLLLSGVPLFRLTPPKPPPLLFRAARRAEGFGLAPSSLTERLRHRYGSTDYNAAHGVMRDVLVRVVNEDYRPRLGEVTVPVGLLWGARDTDAPAGIAREARELFPNVVFYDVVDAADHDLVITDPARARRALAEVVGAACT